MKKHIIRISLFALLVSAFSLTSCREKTPKEKAKEAEKAIKKKTK